MCIITDTLLCSVSFFHLVYVVPKLSRGILNSSLFWWSFILVVTLQLDFKIFFASFLIKVKVIPRNGDVCQNSLSDFYDTSELFFFKELKV